MFDFYLKSLSIRRYLPNFQYNPDQILPGVALVIVTLDGDTSIDDEVKAAWNEIIT